MKFYCIVAYCLFLAQVCADDIDIGYDEKSLFDCNDEGSYTEQQRRDILVLYPIDAYLFVIIGPIASVACLYLISVFMRYPQIRKTPGDLLLGLCIIDMFQSMHQIISGVYYFLYLQSPEDESLFCQSNGFISIFASVADMLYNLAFVCSPLKLVSNTLSAISVHGKTIHIFILVTSILISTLAYEFNAINLNLSGVCTFAPKSKTVDYVKIFIFLIYISIYVVTALSVVSSFRKRTVINDSNHTTIRKQYLYIYKRFIIFSVFIWSGQLILSIINDVNCYQIHSPILNISITAFNSFCVMIPIIQCYIRAQDPILITKTKRFWREIFGMSVVDSLNSSTLSQNLELTQPEERFDSRAHSFPDILQMIQGSIRKTQVYSILAGILLMHKQQKLATIDLDFILNEMIEDEQQDEDPEDFQAQNRRNPYQENNFSFKQMSSLAEIIIDEGKVQETLPGKHEFNVFKTKVTYYSPEIFQYFLDKDHKMVNFEDSLDLFKNSRGIHTFSSGPDGGKSGEFFFYSWDTKIIIKTMQLSELNALRKRMQIYGNYLYNNPDSMISKIYGIYTFERMNYDDSNTSIHVLVMRNISQGTFDMKGSEFDREVLSKKPNVELSSITLKDTDFFKTENKVFIREEYAQQMIENLREDAKFFKEVKLIDYSLLLFKVDWGSYIKDTGIHLKQIRAQISNPSYMIESTKETGIYYHIAIIDYLQEWNVNKSAEQVTKKLIKFNTKLDTSSQNPDVYSERFKSKLVERILKLDQDQTEISPYIYSEQQSIDTSLTQ